MEGITKVYFSRRPNKFWCFIIYIYILALCCFWWSNIDSS